MHIESKEKLNQCSEAVQSHLSILQSVINRMATNSATCKAWCVTLVSAILVIVADKANARFSLIALLPTLLFICLDSYYLSLERGFRKSYNLFVKDLHMGRVEQVDLFEISPEGGPFRHFLKSFTSFSIWPFYLTLLIMIVVMWQCVLD